MDYETAMDEETMVSYAEARQEIAKHQQCMFEFVQEYGEREEYRACDVLTWLGW